MIEKEKTSIRTFIIIAVIFILGFLIYSNTLYNPFIFDDEIYIVDNYQIRDILNFTDFSGTRYIGLLSFAINYYFGGLNTFGYHLVNIVIHIINAILVYFLVQITLQRVQGFEGSRVQENTRPLDSLTPRILPFAVSLIFLVHPIQTQAVSYITQRFTSLATLFYILAIVLYVKARVLGFGGSRVQENTRPPDPLTHGTLYVFSILSTILAMKTKEISFTLPFIIVLYEFTFFNNLDSRPTIRNSQLKTRLLYLTPYLLTLMIIPWELFLAGEGFEQWLRQQQLADISNLSKHDYLLTQFGVIVTYIRLLFLPINQNFDYDYHIAHSIFEVSTLLSFLFLISIFSFAIYLYVWSRKTGNSYGLLASFGMLWFFITLSVESSIIPIRDVIFEHRVYLPSIGAIIAFNTGLFYGLENVKTRLSIKSSVIIALFLSIISAFTIIFSIATYKRNFIWGDLMTMALDMLKKSPNKADVRNEVGMHYFKKGLLDKAKSEIQKAISLQPDFFMAYNNLGLIYLKKGLLEDAERFFKKAIEIKPDYSAAHENLGTVLLENGLIDEALKEYEIAIMMKESPRLYNKIGVLYLKLGNRDTAIKAFKEAIRLEPQGVTPYANMGFAYFDKGDYDKAMEMHGKAIKIMPNFANAHYGLAEVYEKKGVRDKAVEHYKKYIKYADPKEQFVEKAKKKITELGKTE
ncbi:MAG: tetratricopeptide repeat protein [Deltaproteobacteria bacterium]|nr:tetratricopeptide repeat protein [Deltaproteobacteria bacterium]